MTSKESSYEKDDWNSGRPFKLAIFTVVGMCLIALPQVEATILLHESSGFNINGLRLDSGGAPKFVAPGIDLEASINALLLLLVDKR